ncbi:MAG: ferritin-like domain-containing protein [Gorillibacterium sp.]|nr:ferritin-like domain-containing protein [Gorillibacterium sp.]
MYGIYPNWYRPAFNPLWSTTTEQAIGLMMEAVQGERADELFYDELIKLAPNREQASIITSIRNDERGHNQMFRQMYQKLTGREITGMNHEDHKPVKTYIDGLQQALMGELAAVEKYRRIWFGLPEGIYRDTLYGIILDELKHASKYNYLITLNLTARLD